MTAIDVLAVILSVLVLVKISVILIAGPKVWMKVPPFLLRYKQATVLVYSLGLLATGYYLFTALSVTEVMAALLFCGFLLGVSLISYYDCLLKTAQKLMPTRKSLLKQFWLQLLFWTILAIVTLWQVFAKEL